MSAPELLALVISVAVFAYLAYTLLRPERF